MKAARRVALSTVLLASLWSHAQAQTTPSSATLEQEHALAVRRAATLTRGINLSGWFGGWGDYSPEHTSTYITAADVASLKALGIRYVRFPLDPALFMRGQRVESPQRDELWKRIDDALDMLMNAGIAIDLVVFPRDDYKQALTTQRGVDQFTTLWQVLARHFAARDPDRFFFELMNESQTSDSYRWVGIQAQVTYAIRQIAPRHTVLASGAHYDSIPDLLETQPLSDANVIYTFHFYEPYQFTHQGAPWGSLEWNDYKSIPYPATPEQTAALAAPLASDNARYQLFVYGHSDWNAKGIADRLAFAAQWGREHGVPVICNEFGAFRDTAPKDSRTRYLHDVRTGLDQAGISWAMWDWNGNFGLAEHRDGNVVVDPDNAHALGLTLP
jgi:aryl-phospho-beta-D-glucosidase BglC (GH1 family)